MTLTFEQLKARIAQVQQAYWNVLNKKYRTNYPCPTIVWDPVKVNNKTIGIKSDSKTAGRAYGSRLTAYHPTLAMQYPYETINDTVPHEVAHNFVAAHFGRVEQPHGREWLNVMREIGKADAAAKYVILDGVMMDPRTARRIIRTRGRKPR